MTWQSPWAALGLLALVVPVLIHLLARAPADKRMFPTLRFVEATRLPPRARSRVHDPLLLLVRLLVLALAVAALAQPLVRPSRGAAALARVIVVDTSASMRRPFSTGVAARSAVDSARAIARAMTSDSVAVIVVETSAPTGDIAGAVSWLAARSGRGELVLLSDFQRGAVDTTALAAVPRDIGIRLERVHAGPLPESVLLPAEHPAGSVRVTPGVQWTALQWSGARTPTTIDSSGISPVLVHAGGEERARFIAAASRIVGAERANAFVRDSTAAVLFVLPGAPDGAALLARAGASFQPWMAATIRHLATMRLLVALARDVAHDADAEPAPRGGRDSLAVPVLLSARGVPVLRAAVIDTTRLVLFADAGADDPFTVAVARELLRASQRTTSVAEHDPTLMSDSLLRRLSRAPAERVRVTRHPGVSAEHNPVHGGPSDARWLWAAALLALGAEWRMRRAAGSSS